MKNLRDQIIKSKVAKLSQVSPEELDAWDIESLETIANLEQTKKVKNLRQEIARIMKLAGLNYNVEKSNFYSRVNNLRKLKDDE